MNKNTQLVLEGISNGDLMRLSKAALTSGVTLENGGKLSAADEKEFLTNVRNYTETLKRARRYVFSRPSKKIDYLDAERRQTRNHVEGVDANLATATTSQRLLEPIWLELAWGMTDEFRMDNIEGDGAAQTLDAIFTELFGMDLADLAWLGDPDTDNAVEDATFKQMLKGWRAHMSESNDVQVVDSTGITDIMGVLFPAIIAAMPDKFKKVKESKPALIVSSDVRELYLAQWRNKVGSARGDRAAEDGVMPKFDGYDVIEEVMLPKKEIVFGNPTNPCFGQRSNNTEFESDRYVLKGMTVYVLRAWCGYQLREPEGLVWSRDGAYVPGRETF